jgi:hypothetical protein
VQTLLETRFLLRKQVERQDSSGAQQFQAAARQCLPVCQSAACCGCAIASITPGTAPHHLLCLCNWQLGAHRAPKSCFGGQCEVWGAWQSTLVAHLLKDERGEEAAGSSQLLMARHHAGDGETGPEVHKSVAREQAASQTCLGKRGLKSRKAGVCSRRVRRSRGRRSHVRSERMSV